MPLMRLDLGLLPTVTRSEVVWWKPCFGTASGAGKFASGWALPPMGFSGSIAARSLTTMTMERSASSIGYTSTFARSWGGFGSPLIPFPIEGRLKPGNKTGGGSLGKRGPLSSLWEANVFRPDPEGEANPLGCRTRP